MSGTISTHEAKRLEVMKRPTPSDSRPGFSLAPDDGKVALVMRAAEPSNALLAFSLRYGGCSPAPFDSLNFSLNEGDAAENIAGNLSILTRDLQLNPASIAFARQVHGDAIAVLDSVPRVMPTADALVTRAPGLFLAIKTADCVPIMLLDPARNIVAAVHAGWNGTLQRIVKKVVRLMTSEFGTDPSDLLAAVGPAIGPCCYEVDDRVLEPFRREFPGAESFIGSLAQLMADCEVPRHNPKALTTECREFLHARGSEPRPLKTSREASRSFRLDLVGANIAELRRAGVPQGRISALNLCTACYPDLFFSHRRDHGQTGRHVAIIGIRGPA